MVDVQEESAAPEEAGEPVFYDTLFRQKRKKGKYRIVNAPRLGASVADTHAHLHMLPDPALALARCAVHGVDFICAITDVMEDGTQLFDNLKQWQFKGAIGIRNLSC